MRYLLIFIIILLVLFQSSVADDLVVKSAVPNFLLSFLIAFSLLKNFRESIACAFFGGILLDLIVGWPFGLITLSFILTVGLANFLISNFLQTENLAVIAGFSFAVVLFYFLLNGILLKSANFLKLTELSPDLFYNFIHLGLPSAVYNIFLIVLFYLGIKKLEKNQKVIF
jgi:rod shape-determining protein MreD